MTEQKQHQRLPILPHLQELQIVVHTQTGINNHPFTSAMQYDHDSAADKMENTMQNIILQEMESHNGILIATTNLQSNVSTSATSASPTTTLMSTWTMPSVMGRNYNK